MNTYTHTYDTYIHISYRYICMYIHMHAYIHKYIHTYIHTYTYIL